LFFSGFYGVVGWFTYVACILPLSNQNKTIAMKKFLLIIFAAGLLTAHNTFASTYNNDTAYQEKVYTKIAADKVAASVLKEITEKYEGYTIAEAYASEDSEYKLVLKKEQTQVTVFYNSKGEFLKEQK
jgi:hypothetical protein